MPYLNVKSSQAVENEDEVTKAASKLIAQELGKPESYVMAAFESENSMTFGGSTEASVFMELKSIGLPSSQTEDLSEALCKFAEEELGVDKERVYIVFEDISGEMWGWNGSTF